MTLLSAAEEQTFEPSQSAIAIQRCTDQLAERFDAALGGFGGAPKFPRPAEVNLLLVAAQRDASADRAASSSGASASGAPQVHQVIWKGELFRPDPLLSISSLKGSHRCTFQSTCADGCGRLCTHQRLEARISTSGTTGMHQHR